MQTADLVLAIAVPLVAMLAGWVGVELSLIPPERQTPKQRPAYRAVFILLMLTAIVLNIWQTARSAKQQDDAKSEYQQKQGELTNKVSEQGGKLDAIAHFEQQFLTFVSQSQRSPTGSPDAQTKAYEAMALAVMRMAQGTSPGPRPDVSLHILYDNANLDGQTISTTFTLLRTGPGAPAGFIPEKRFQLSGFSIRNSGARTSDAISVRLCFANQVFPGGISWERKPGTPESDDPDFPTCIPMDERGGAVYIKAGDTWDVPQFSGVVENWNSSSFSGQIKVFSGADRQVIANFSIRASQIKRAE